jgi:hypothetical protein
MGYFSNGSEAEYYQAKYCNNCIHDLSKHGCPVMELHWLWNYDSNNDEDKKLVLDMFIPPDGVFNGKCLMFCEIE